MTYVKRTYFPFVLREPQLRCIGGRVASALWAYADPTTVVLIIPQTSYVHVVVGQTCKHTDMSS